MSKKPSYSLLYLLIGILFILMSFFTSESLDIAIYDTYYVIAKQHIYLALGLLFFLFSAIIWIFKCIQKPLNKRLLLIHFLVTTVSVVSSVGLLFLLIENSTPKRYTDYSAYNDFNSTSSVDFNFWLMITVVTGLSVQVLFVVNMVLSLFRRKQS